MSDVLITPASSKIEFKDASNNIDGTVKLDSSGNLELTSNNGISFGDTSSDVFIGNGTDNVDLKFDADGSITGTSGVTLTLGSSNSNVKIVSNELSINSTSGIITANTFSGSGSSLTGVVKAGISSTAFATDPSGSNDGLEPHSNVSFGTTIGQKIGFTYDNFNQYMTIRSAGDFGRSSGSFKIRTDIGHSTNSVYENGSGATIAMANSDGRLLLQSMRGQFNVGEGSGGNDFNGFVFFLDGTMKTCCSSTAGENIRIQRRSNGNAIEFGDTATNTIGSISLNTSANTTAYNETSDYRIKENVVGITSALDKINQLRPVNFNFIGKSVKLDGFLAHEVQEVIPYAVTGEKDAVKTVKDGDLSDDGSYEDEVRIAALPTKEIPSLQQLDKTKLITLLTASVQELSAKNDALEARIKALESGGS